nr:MAG TPA: hypothetical protein [Caudoviricetes sp.]
MSASSNADSFGCGGVCHFYTRQFFQLRYFIKSISCVCARRACSSTSCDVLYLNIFATKIKFTNILCSHIITSLSYLPTILIVSTGLS